MIAPRARGIWEVARGRNHRRRATSHSDIRGVATKRVLAKKDSALSGFTPDGMITMDKAINKIAFTIENHTKNTQDWRAPLPAGQLALHADTRR